MNDRIQELADEAKAYCHETFQNTKSAEWMPYTQMYDKKFAELIVKETVLEVWIQLFNHGIDLSENTLFLEAMKKTKEHFGVEE